MSALPVVVVRRSLLLAAATLCAAALPGQGKKPKKGDKQEPAKVEAKTEAPKDDAITAKDPVIVALDKFAKSKVAKKREDWRTAMPRPPEVKFTPGRDYLWHVTTSKGDLLIRLLPAAAPRHVESTIYLARAGFFDGLVFPRILKGFMAQGGSPTNTQSGNAGYTLDLEASGEKHDGPGVLSAANAGAPDTDGSQFFLTFAAAPHLDGKYSVFGRVIAGLEVLPAIEKCGVEKDGDKLVDPPAIVRSWITVVDAGAADGKGEKGGGDAEPKEGGGSRGK